jgi:hypothetical protein
MRRGSPGLRVVGHALRNEGAPHDMDGILRFYAAGGEGHGWCQCGAMSGWLTTTAARKKWHRQHKREVSAALARRELGR